MNLAKYIEHTLLKQNATKEARKQFLYSNIAKKSIGE